MYLNKNKKNITIVGTHGRHTSLYLQDYIKKKGIKSHAVGMYFRNESIIQKIQSAKTLICINYEIKTAVEEAFDISDKLVICLNVNDSIDSDTKKIITGEEWVEYQEKHVYPKLEKQIRKYLPKLEKAA